MNIKKSPYLSSVESIKAPNIEVLPAFLAICPSTASNIVPNIRIIPPILKFPREITIDENRTIKNPVNDSIFGGTFDKILTKGWRRVRHLSVSVFLSNLHLQLKPQILLFLRLTFLIVL